MGEIIQTKETILLFGMNHNTTFFNFFYLKSGSAVFI